MVKVKVDSYDVAKWVIVTRFIDDFLMMQFFPCVSKSIFKKRIIFWVQPNIHLLQLKFEVISAKKIHQTFLLHFILCYLSLLGWLLIALHNIRIERKLDAIIIKIKHFSMHSSILSAISEEKNISSIRSKIFFYIF